MCKPYTFLQEWYNDANKNLSNADLGLHLGRGLYAAYSVDKKINPTKNLKTRLMIGGATAFIYGLSHLLAREGYKLRDKRQKEMFYKTMQNNKSMKSTMLILYYHFFFQYYTFFQDLALFDICQDMYDLSS